jgi:hypothetical protein
MRRHIVEWLKVLVIVAYLWLVMLFVLQDDRYFRDPGADIAAPFATWRP